MDIYIYIYTHTHTYTCGLKQGFFFSFFWIQPLAGCTGDHPQEELAKFGYRSERKVEQFKNHAIFIFWNLLSKYDNFRKKNSSNSGDFGTFFFTKNLSMGFFFSFCCQVVKITSHCGVEDGLDCCRFIESAPL